MRCSILVFSLLVAPFAETARAEALAPPGPMSSCLSANVQVLRPLDNGQALYRIVFVNRCELPRSFFWCAEHPSMRMPAPVACRSQGGFGPELRHAIVLRKEFQWHMPAGARIRFQDCSGLEIPTADFNCAPQAAARR
jgi:hypothetical protein